MITRKRYEKVKVDGQVEKIHCSMTLEQDNKSVVRNFLVVGDKSNEELNDIFEEQALIAQPDLDKKVQQNAPQITIEKGEL
jgi:hypothetical protein